VSGETAAFDTAQIWRLRTVWDSIFSAEVPNMVNPGRCDD
jgi:hypothetical protein